MKSGGFYDLHSEYQRRVIEAGDQLIRESIEALELGSAAPALTIVDYGAGTGATSVHAVRTAVEGLRRRDPELPVLAVHNDVLTSDFSQLFRNVASPDGYLALAGGPVYVAAAAGSFFTQVVPSATVQLGMCSNASHWLREQPRLDTPDGMYLSDITGKAREALGAQAARDWVGFVGARAVELAPGGRLLVQGIGATTIDGREQVSASRLLRVMWQVATGLADDGQLDPEVLNGYVFPAYCRSVGEVTEPCREGGPLAGELEVVSAAVDEVPSPYWERFERDGDAGAYAKAYVEFVRAFAESTMLEHLFEPGARGTAPEALCDQYFGRLEIATAADPAAGRYEAWVVRFVARRRRRALGPAGT
jgi:cyclopropane-fatty-acyl-phospholipid synthase